MLFSLSGDAILNCKDTKIFSHGKQNFCFDSYWHSWGISYEKRKRPPDGGLWELGGGVCSSPLRNAVLTSQADKTATGSFVHAEPGRAPALCASLANVTPSTQLHLGKASELSCADVSSSRQSSIKLGSALDLRHGDSSLDFRCSRRPTKRPLAVLFMRSQAGHGLDMALIWS